MDARLRGATLQRPAKGGPGGPLMARRGARAVSLTLLAVRAVAHGELAFFTAQLHDVPSRQLPGTVSDSGIDALAYTLADAVDLPLENVVHVATAVETTVYFGAAVRWAEPPAEPWEAIARRLEAALAPQLGVAGGGTELLALRLAPAGEPGAAHLQGRVTLSAEDANLAARALATVQGAFLGCALPTHDVAVLPLLGQGPGPWAQDAACDRRMGRGF